MFDLQTSHNIAIFVVKFIGKEFTRRNTKMFKNTKIVNFTISILKNSEGHVLPPLVLSTCYLCSYGTARYIIQICWSKTTQCITSGV